MNPNILPNLGSVEYCLMDKTGTLTTNDFEVKSLELSEQQYSITGSQKSNLKKAGAKSESKGRKKVHFGFGFFAKKKTKNQKFKKL